MGVGFVCWNFGGIWRKVERIENLFWRKFRPGKVSWKYMALSLGTFDFIWANQVLHLASHIMSRVEGAHITLKLSRQFLRWLVGGEREYYSCGWHSAASNQRKNSNWVSPGSNISYKDFFSNVIRKISCFALLKIKKWIWMFGLSFAHIMQLMQCALSLNDIHSQWQLDRPVILPLLPVAQFAKVRNPIVLQERRIPMGASNNSTHRDPF